MMSAFRAGFQALIPPARVGSVPPFGGDEVEHFRMSLTLASAARLLGVSDGLVGEEGEAVTDGLDVD
jgi:hypothetical protein